MNPSLTEFTAVNPAIATRLLSHPHEIIPLLDIAIQKVQERVIRVRSIAEHLNIRPNMHVRLHGEGYIVLILFVQSNYKV